MKLLLLDTATENCSCALAINGEYRVLSELAPRRHAERILEMAEQLLAEAELSPAQLDGLGFGRGPGSFTGLRIGCGVVQGIALGADLPVACISSLAMLAQGAYADFKTPQVFAAIDARMSEIYWGLYQLNADQCMVPLQDECVLPAKQVPLPIAEAKAAWQGVGSGWLCEAESLTTRTGDWLKNYDGQRYPQAQDMLPLALAAFQQGEVLAAEQVAPVYLRNQVVAQPTKPT
ncbi:tRNA (adenosine(37)-N6)-threonylcarbamoyltransferase complex dimerization subunit type 1 TsaB [Candidatus Venteria ishoeyi]|uniref:tRNA threonylcarbamoyladenosine biosynthesis protein TsaB n=1 Tax=Candidatus Venteria ishoeyi TaxID=1899563 RepID=A0A1H6F524_9GAMM|nr:tRNA (adenosine(37)-N6)-threonylcarbamoyltransferase complex dimerization subunit type 1 TsaB [Candidatus Venteria ishoeyi]SEH04481.1 tRNA threonylcarbamoyladenosine biosynthesis protein TsaB [Candidatus Venteria ishoeyi]